MSTSAYHFQIVSLGTFILNGSKKLKTKGYLYLKYFSTFQHSIGLFESSLDFYLIKFIPTKHWTEFRFDFLS